MEMPLFSIVIPAYIDSELDGEYLQNALQSIRNQTFKDYEIIIMDDCSPISLDVNIKDVRKIRNEKNEGIGYTRQKGIDEAKGRYITFLSHDDWWEIGFLEEMSKHLDDKVLYGDIRIYEQGKFRNAPLPSRENKSDFLKMVWDLAYKFWTFTHWSCMVFPKKFFEILPINKNLRIAEDYEWNLKASHLFPFEHISEYLAVARYHEGMGSKGAPYSAIDSEIIKEVKEWLKEKKHES